MRQKNESRDFLQKLLRHPPTLPFESQLLPLLFAVTRDDSTASTRQLVALLEQSQRLAAQVLAMANSAAYGLESGVSDLHRAISLLGVREVRRMVLMVGMSSFLQRVKLPSGFALQSFWKHHLLTAAISRALAETLGAATGPCGPVAAEADRLTAAPDEAYLIGLLHDMGKVFLAMARPDVWQEIECLRAHHPDTASAENACWGMDHALIGAAVMHSWNLPLLLTEPINWHHAPHLAVAYKMEARLLAAADRLAAGDEEAGDGLEEVLALLPPGCDTAALQAAACRGRAAVAAAEANILA